MEGELASAKLGRKQAMRGAKQSNPAEPCQACNFEDDNLLVPGGRDVRSFCSILKWKEYVFPFYFASLVGFSNAVGLNVMLDDFENGAAEVGRTGSFRASDGWEERFLQCHSLQELTRSGLRAGEGIYL